MGIRIIPDSVLRLGGRGGELRVYWPRGYASYISGLAPLVWSRMNESSGATCNNSGTLGSALNGAYTACTLAQAGQLGLQQAFLTDGLTSVVTVPDNAAINNLQAFTYACLVNPSGAGENSQGNFWGWSGGTHAVRFLAATTALQALVARSGGSMLLRTTTGLTIGEWAWLFFTVDVATGGHLYKGRAGVAEYAYSTAAQSSGSISATSTSLLLANNSIANSTFSGLYDEFLLFDKVLTPTQMEQIVSLSGL